MSCPLVINCTSPVVDVLAGAFRARPLLSVTCRTPEVRKIDIRFSKIPDVLRVGLLKSLLKRAGSNDMT